jgi:outer membrane protein assembly factor BamE
VAFEAFVRVIAVLLMLSLVGCSFHMPRIGIPRVHRITIQQGNVITQTMIDQLKPGMTKRQVAFIMGEPVMRNSFNPDRWDFIYAVTVPNVGSTQRRATLYFNQDLLAYFTGDYAPSSFSLPPPEDYEAHDRALVEADDDSDGLNGPGAAPEADAMS